MSFLNNFTLPTQTPPLVGGLGQGGDMDKFVELFGERWKKTPVKGVWCLARDGAQFTMVLLAERGMDFAHYDYDTVAEFRTAFEAKEHVGNAQYFQLTGYGEESQYKYPALRIIAFMKEQGIW